MEKRKGPLTKEDKQFIHERSGILKPTQIANQLSRNVQTIVDYMKENNLISSYIPNANDKFSLSKTPYWHNLSLQFDQDELKLIDHHWKSIVEQFQDDIQHTEELQILDLIKMEALSNRILNEQANVKNKIREYEQDILKQKRKTHPDIEEIDAKEAQIAALYSTYETSGKEYNNLIKEKSNLFKSLKATREQRYKNYENSKHSLLDWVKLLIEDKDRRRHIGIYIEKMRLATEVEYQRLSEYHTYNDGTVEKPILNSDTVLVDEEEKKEESILGPLPKSDE